ncbi:hypothetical protein [Lactobacillus sp. PV034]|nr:hypothetical protein [Lactobacillus sp. PV034]QNQ80537.1 NRT1/PTR family MFS transporter [Lactobacillus sp. PV034]
MTKKDKEISTLKRISLIFSIVNMAIGLVITILRLTANKKESNEMKAKN